MKKRRMKEGDEEKERMMMRIMIMRMNIKKKGRR